MAAIADLRRALDGDGLLFLVLDGEVTAVAARDLMALSAADLCRSAVRFSLKSAMAAAIQQRLYQATP